MAQWARRGKKQNIMATFSRNFCAVRVVDGAIQSGVCRLDCPTVNTAQEAVDELTRGNWPAVNVENSSLLVNEVRSLWAAQFDEPALAPDLAADLDEVINGIDRALLEEMDVAADALATELATWAASKKQCPKCNGTGWTEWAHGINGNCTECLGFGVALVEQNKEPDQAQIDRINHDFETAARLDREARLEQGDHEFLAFAD